MTNQETLVAVYDNMDSATNTVADLTAAGFDPKNVSLVANNVTGHYAEGVENMTGSEGAGLGAVVGGVTGVLAGLTAIVIPGIGPIIAAGPLAALLGGATGAVVGATAGAVTGGLTASLIDMGVPSDHADYYAESVRRGSCLLTVHANNDDEASIAMNILRHHHPIDTDRRVRQWREKGWQGFDSQAEPYNEQDLVTEGRMYHEDTQSPPKDDTVRRYPPTS